MRKINNKGITLVVLVITIVVMLILVGTVLYFSFGQGGLILKTKEAKEQTETSETKENVDMMIVGEKKRDGTVNLDEIKSKLENMDGIEDVEERFILSRDSKVIGYKLNGKRYYIDKDGKYVEGYIGLLPQGEWNIEMSAGRGNGNILNVKIDEREITLNSDDIIAPGFQNRNCCLMITDTVKNANIDDGGVGQISQSLDGSIKYPLKSGDVITFSANIIGGNASVSNPATLRFANNSAVWENMMIGFGGSGYKVKSPYTLTSDINYTGIYFTRFNNVKFDNYKIEVSYKINGMEIL